MNLYDTAVKVAQRFLFGSIHHSHLASLFDLLGLKEQAEQHREHAQEEFDKHLQIDKLITKELGKFPNYLLPSITTIAAQVGNLTTDQIKSDEKEWIKKAFADAENYEKETLKMFENLKEGFKTDVGEIKDSLFHKFFNQLVKSLKQEIEQIAEDKEQLERLQYDKEKIKKGEHKMPRHYREDYRMDYPLRNPLPYMDYDHDEDGEESEHDMARRHRMEREDMERRHDYEMRRRRRYR